MKNWKARGARMAAVATLMLMTGCAASGSGTPETDSGAHASQQQAQVLRVHRSAGTVQCGGDQPIDLQALAQPMIEAGFAPARMACGWDGRAYPAMCGAPDGRIAIFEMHVSDPQSTGARLKELGYALADEYPDAEEAACR